MPKYTRETFNSALVLLFIGIFLGLYVLQAEIAIRSPKPIRLSIGEIAYGYHAGSDHCAGGAANGTVQSGEGCDDNNSNNSDGCSSVCIVESGWSCTGSPSTCTPICGNGSKHGSEGCDDANTTNGDGCSSTCSVESGWSCTGAGAGSCTPICGNGAKHGSEGCDDGNTTSSDGCSSTCAVESGWTCSGTPSTCSATSCGDGIRAGSEQCDDGNSSNTDACLTTCLNASCGDGYVRSGTEQCDDGNSSNTDACLTTCLNATCGDRYVRAGVEECDSSGTCSADCRIVSGAGTGGGGGGGGGSIVPRRNPPPPPPPGPPAACGNGVLETDKEEECDEGRFNGLRGCSEDCHRLFCGDGVLSRQVPVSEECEVFVEEEQITDPVTGEPTIQYWFATAACGTSCTMPHCDGCDCEGGCKVEFLPPCQGEVTVRRLKAPPLSCFIEAEGAVASAPSRPPPPANCGNNVVEKDKGEQCDRGIANGVGDCTRWCEKLSCGDGVISGHLAEECEPERNASGSFITPAPCGTVCAPPTCDAKGTCKGGCRRLFQPACLKVEAASISSLTATGAVASSSSLPPMPFIPSMPSVPSLSEPQPPPPLCGNLDIEGTEECDDGNLLAHDGCSPSCTLEPLAKGRCGDGIKDPWEECDMGLRNSDTTPSTCRTSCRSPSCGDGVVDREEECDDGNTVPGDGCSALCTRPGCGNGILDPWEECDQGKGNGDTLPDTCRTSCTLPRCGDGVMDPSFGEECDTGIQNSDTAPNTCRTSCRLASCGDGVKDAAEQCDDGNTKDDDRCTNSCKLTEAQARKGAKEGGGSVVLFTVVTLLLSALALAGYFFLGGPPSGLGGVLRRLGF